MRISTVHVTAIVLLAVFAGLMFAVDESSADDSDYEVKTVSFHSQRPDAPSSLELRYYNVTPDIPYLNISGVFGLHTGKTMSVAYAGLAYVYTNPVTGQTAEFYPDSGILSIDDYSKFISPAQGEDMLAPYQKSAYRQVVAKAGAVDLQLRDYSIAYYPDGSEVWIPLATAADVLMGPESNYTFVIGNSDVFDLGIGDMSNQSDIMKSYLVSMIMAAQRAGDRSQAEAQFSYNELCFAFDSFYGKPIVSPLGKELQTMKLDAVLNSHSDATKTISNWLKSTDIEEYLAGLILLGDYLYDGGHTQVAFNAEMLEKFASERAEEIKRLVRSVEVPDGPDRKLIQEKLATARSAVWGDSGYYEKGDTAVFTFDSFTVDQDAWIEYYLNEGEVPSDTYGSMISALNRAQSNPQIRNFVVDISTNTGGDLDAAMGVVALMTGNYALFNIGNSVSGERYRSANMYDTNIDGVFDSADLTKQYDFRFALLTSCCSFSSGNLVPVYAKGCGIMIIGDTSGGGSCAVQVGGTTNGMLLSMSSGDTIYDYGWASVEAGAAPDLRITDTRDVDADLTGMYDIDLISRAMNDHYKVSDGFPAFIVLIAILVVVGAVAAVRTR